MGYGDIVPSSTLSRCVVIGCVFFFLCTIPYQIGQSVRPSAPRLALSDTVVNQSTAPLTPLHRTPTDKTGKLMEALSSRSMYRSAYFRPLRNTEHILILGRVTYPVLARHARVVVLLLLLLVFLFLKGGG